jgi:hypothetical protein
LAIYTGMEIQRNARINKKLNIKYIGKLQEKWVFLGVINEENSLAYGATQLMGVIGKIIFALVLGFNPPENKY